MEQGSTTLASVEPHSSGTSVKPGEPRPVGSAQPGTPPAAPAQPAKPNPSRWPKASPKLAVPVMFVPGRIGTSIIYGHPEGKLTVLRLPCECHTEADLALAEAVIECYDRENSTNRLNAGGHVERLEGLEEIGRWKGENKHLNQVLFKSIMGSVSKKPITQIATSQSA